MVFFVVYGGRAFLLTNAGIIIPALVSLITVPATVIALAIKVTDRDAPLAPRLKKDEHRRKKAS